MAWGKKKAGRKEPMFGLPAALADLRLTAADRIPNAEDKPKKSGKPSARRKSEEADDEPPRERKASGGRSGADAAGQTGHVPALPAAPRGDRATDAAFELQSRHQRDEQVATRYRRANPGALAGHRQCGRRDRSGRVGDGGEVCVVVGLGRRTQAIEQRRVRHARASPTRRSQAVRTVTDSWSLL